MGIYLFYFYVNIHIKHSMVRSAPPGGERDIQEGVVLTGTECVVVYR